MPILCRDDKLSVYFAGAKISQNSINCLSNFGAYLTVNKYIFMIVFCHCVLIHFNKLTVHCFIELVCVYASYFVSTYHFEVCHSNVKKKKKKKGSEWYICFNMNPFLAVFAELIATGLRKISEIKL